MNRMIKRTTSAFLVVAIMCLSISVSGLIRAEESFDQTNTTARAGGDLTGPDYYELDELLAENIQNLNTDIINVLPYKIVKEDAYKYLHTYLRGNFLYRFPELFYIDYISIHGSSSTKYVEGFTLVYTDSIETIKKQRATFDQASQEFLNSVPKGISDKEKVLYANDYLCYDMEYVGSAPAGMHAYESIVNHTGKCYHYVLAFTHYMKLLGIENTYVISKNNIHAWNMVKLDGNWYHVDTTWNDNNLIPKAALGAASHNYFLLSDEAMIADKKTYTWDTSKTPPATDTQYDNAFWRDIHSPFIYQNGEWYYINYKKSSNFPMSHTINRYNFKTGQTNQVHRISSLWYLPNGIGYINVLPTLGTYGGKLYYNTADAIYSIQFDGTNETKIAGKSPVGSGNTINDFDIKNGVLTYRLWDNSRYYFSNAYDYAEEVTLDLTGN